MGGIFISHAAEDAAVAGQIADHIRLAGHSAFLDSDRRDGIAPGAAWQKTLFHELRICDAVVFLNSDAAQSSRWCHSELVVADERGKRVYSLDLEPHLSPHPLLRSRQGITFDPDLERAIGQLTDALAAGGLAEGSRPRWRRGRAPYPGLAAMDVADAGVFFGREREVRDLIARVDGSPGQGDGDLVIVMGPSGVGKSSLVRAGLVAILSRPGSGWAAAAPFEPGIRPVDRLVSHLTALAPGQLTETVCRDRLEHEGLAVLGEWLVDHGETQARRLLITLDQADQLAAVTPSPDRENFIQALVSGLGPGSPVTIVMTTRSDRFDEIQRLPGIGVMIRSTFVIAPMDRSELGAIIEGPASRADLSFEPGLVTRLVDDTARERERAADALPLLAFALREMYDRIREEDRGAFTGTDYEQIGRIDGAIEGRAASAEETFPPESGPVLDRMLTRFVALDEDHPAAARPVPRAELTSDERIVATRLEDHRLLVGTSGTADTVRLAHERLITAWPRLRTAVEQHRDDLLAQARIERQARDWRGKRGALLGRGAAEEASSWLERTPDGLATVSDDVRKYIHASWKELRRRRKRLIGTMSAIAALAVVASVIAVIAVIQRSVAITQTQLAQSEQMAAESTNVLPADAPLGMLLSLQAYERAATLQARSALIQAGQEPLRNLLQSDSSIMGVAFSPDGRTLAAGDYNGDVALWDVASGHKITTLPEGATAGSVAFSPDGRTLAVGDYNGGIGLWDVASGHKITTLPEGSAVGSVAFGPDGRTLAAGDANGDVALWDVASRYKIGTLPEGSTVESVAFSPDGRTLAVGDDDGGVRLWNVASRHKISTLPEGATVDSVAFSPDGDMLAAGDDNGGIGLWNPASGHKITTLPEGSALESVAFSPDGRMLAAGDANGDVGLWDVASRHKITTLPEGNAAASVAFSPDGHTLAVGDGNGDVGLWNPEAAQLISLTQGDPVISVAFSPDGRTLAAGDADGDVGLWDVASGLMITTLPEGSGVESVAFSPDGRTLAAGDADGGVGLWDVASGRKITTLREGGEVESVAFSPGGRMLAAGDYNGGVGLWNQASGHKITTLPEGSTVESVAFSPDGRTLAAGDYNGGVGLWDVASRHRITTLPEGATVASVAFSSDGRTLAADGVAGTVDIWDVANNQQLASLTEEIGKNEVLAFSPSSAILAIAGGDGQVALVRQNFSKLTKQYFASLICGEVRRNLTPNQWAEYAPGQARKNTCP